jgi:hypothetical protein
MILCSTTNSYSQTSKPEIRISLRRAVALDDSLHRLALVRQSLDSSRVAVARLLAAHGRDSTALAIQKSNVAVALRAYEHEHELHEDSEKKLRAMRRSRNRSVVREIILGGLALFGFIAH